jgi:hypothetical protein
MDLLEANSKVWLWLLFLQINFQQLHDDNLLKLLKSLANTYVPTHILKEKRNNSASLNSDSTRV